MINPATSWFEIVELPVSKLEELDIPSVDQRGKKKGKKSTHVSDEKPKEAYFDKSSDTVSSLVNQCWFSDIHDVDILYTTMVVNLNFTSKPFVIPMG